MSFLVPKRKPKLLPYSLVIIINWEFLMLSHIQHEQETTNGKATTALSNLIFIGKKMCLYLEKYTNYKIISQGISIK